MGWRVIVLLIWTCSLAAVSALGQEFETKLGTETVEVGGGIQYFNRHSGGTENQVETKLLGGLSRFVSLFGEYSCSRTFSETVYVGPTVEGRASVMEVGGGAQVHFSGYRVQPYALLGLATIRDSGKLSIGSSHAVRGSNQFAYDLGGGVRMFAVRSFGFLVEAKTVRGTEGRLFEQYSVGAFYQRRRPGW